MKRSILIADDSERTREQLRTLLAADGRYEVDTTGDGAAALERLSARNYSVFLTDLKMPGLDGMQLIEQLHERQVPVTVIVMTGYGSIAQAVQAMRLGAYDFLPKPVDPDHLCLVIDRAVRARGLMDELVQLREQIRRQHTFQNMVSKSPRMHAIFELISNVAETTATVLIEGETGTGKEQVARAIHESSAALRKGHMVAINCAALPENLLESELFGHEKGAFTSAISQRIGRFEQANGGTLFLDEVGDIPPAMQAKLLRVLQERRFEPRPIAPEAMERLLAHHWPGNIRELENALERACVIARGPSIQPGDLPPEVLTPRAESGGRAADINRPLPDVLREATVELEKQYLRRALKKTRGNINRCAQISGLSRRSISAKLAEYHIDKDVFKRED
jgi:DNA-binding NtrC family response regulator